MFSPQGEVKGVRQVAARFSEPMVPFGDPRLADPFDVDCPQPGAGRWADQKNWVFDFERDLPAGVRCSFHVKQDLKTLAGAAVEPQQFSFTTGGPAVIEQMPRRDAQVDEEQVFILGLDAPVRDDTVRAHAWCDAQGIAERIGVQLVTGEERRQILDSRKDFVDRWLIALFKDGRVARVAAAELERGSNGRAARASGGNAAVAGAVALCAQAAGEQPAAAGVGAGHRVAVGRAHQPGPGAGVHRAARLLGELLVPARECRCRLSAVRADAVELHGAGRAQRRREDAAAWCGWKGLQAQAAGRRPGGRFRARRWSSPGRFPEEASFKLEIPADLRDDAGRRLTNQKRFPLTVRTDVAPPLAKFPAALRHHRAEGRCRRCR